MRNYPKGTKNDKRRLYWLIDEFILGRIDEQTFCDEYYYSYNLEIDSATYNETEKRVFGELGKVSDRFSPFESDYELDARAFTNKNDLRQAINVAKRALTTRAEVVDRKRIFKHKQPVWEDKADTSVFVPLKKDDLFSEDYDFEEIPALLTENSQYKICAIPLLVHDINLDDVVKADSQRLYEKTVTDSGRYGFRLAINIPDSHTDENVSEFEEVIGYLEKQDCNIEFLSHLIVGVDVDNEKKARKLSGELSKMVSRKLLIAYDTTRS